MKKTNKKIFAWAEILLAFSIIFTFSYFIKEISNANNIIESKNRLSIASLLKIIGKLIFNENSFVSAASSSDLSQGVFTCINSKSGKSCQEYSPGVCQEECADACIPSRRSDVAACKLGTCYDEEEGICQPGSPQSTCVVQNKEWFDDPYGNIKECKLGCCLIGSQAIFVTEQRCVKNSQTLNAKYEFKSNIKTELECLALSALTEEGACIYEEDFEKNCHFTTKSQCQQTKGKFYSGYLCSNPALNTSCKPQQSTGCFQGKDEVYWFDSCGNRENIYSIPKASSHNQGKVFSKNESCALGTASNLLFNSATCGNCDYILGSKCGKVTTEKVSIGEYICKDMSCIDESGKRRSHGEAWCEYQGSIGLDSVNNRATDTVGSRHIRKICYNGEIRAEPCADYRNEICVESQTSTPSGKFSSSACRINLAQQCLSYNTLEDKDKMKEQCNKNPDCFVKSVSVSNNFEFSVCAPKYPSGFSLEENERGEGAETICSFASQTCKYVKVKGAFGGGKEINKECLSNKFAEQMNDLCISLGDCGGKANYEGVYTENFKVTNSEQPSEAYISTLIKYSETVKGKYAEAGDLNAFYGVLGILEGLGSADVPANKAEAVIKMASLISGALGISLIIGAKLAPNAFSGFFAGLNPSGYSVTQGGTFSLYGFGNALAGAAIAMAVLSMLMQFTGVTNGLPPAMTYALLSAGTVAGGIIGYNAAIGGSTFGSFSSGGLATAVAASWVAIAVIVVVIIVLTIFGVGKKKEIDVTFQCKPWQAPTGGTDCSKCGKDGFPCTPYSCASLGQACQLINENTGEEQCAAISQNDTSSPIIQPLREVISESHSYKDVTEAGFKIESTEKCLVPYTQLVFGISLDEQAQCKFDVKHTDKFDDMQFDFGLSTLYRRNHTMFLPIPDLSSLGLNGYDPNITSDYNLYIRCKDKMGNENLREYNVNFCIKQGEDLTSPRILNQKPSPAYARIDETFLNVSVFTNEPAQCKFDKIDAAYETMAYEMQCENDIEDNTLYGFQCIYNFSVTENENNFFIRCKDQPWFAGANESKRNTNSESYKLTIIRPSSQLVIETLSPDNQTLKFGTEPSSIILSAKTSGGLDGTAKCYFEWENQLIEFRNTLGQSHSQHLQSIYPGTYSIKVVCEDFIGNKAEKIARFSIELDNLSPKIARVYESSSSLTIITNEPAQCYYSTLIPLGGENPCAFSYQNATEMSGSELVHSTPFDSLEKYFIKCKDNYENSPGTDCSLIVKKGA